jgi:GTPase Era involved in 16S rRNA processing
MWQTLLIWLIIALCAFFIGRRFFRQWRSALSGKTVSCCLDTLALSGNPNAGKTTLFNHLTGARQHVGNYPGITVEQKEGSCLHRRQGLRVVDLPGTYSLTAYSVEELVARDFIINEKPDVVVDVVDASNLERNLYLSCQFLELGTPLVIALNMVDVAHRHQISGERRPDPRTRAKRVTGHRRRSGG